MARSSPPKLYPRHLAQVAPPLVPDTDWQYLTSDVIELRVTTDVVDYQPSTAWILAELSLLAYCTQAQVAQQLKKAGFSNFVWLENGPHAGFCCVKNSARIVVFRGTRAIKFSQADGIPGLLSQAKNWVSDWATNLTAATKPATIGGSIHSGFNDAVDMLKPQLNAWFESTQGKVTFIAGHSLGAAMAIIASATSDFPCAVYTFGSPCVGDAEYANAMIKKHNVYRHVFMSDIVPNLPVELLRYRHVESKLLAIVPAQNPLYEDKLAFVNGMRKLPMVNVLAAVIDHAPMSYAAATYNALR
jgi:hypothetical protein